MTTKVVKTKSGKGYRITITETKAERKARLAKREAEAKRAADSLALTPGQARRLRSIA